MQENESVKIATQELSQVSKDLVNQRIAELREKARRGKKIVKEQIAQKLLTLNVPIEQISEATELSIKEIEKLFEN